MISFSWSEEQVQLQQTARKFPQDEIRPVEAEYDRKPDPRDCIPMDVVKKGVALGFSTMTIPGKIRRRRRYSVRRQPSISHPTRSRSWEGTA